MEKDQVRGNDSLVTFEEILQIAKDKDVSSLLQKTYILFPWKDWAILFSILITWIGTLLFIYFYIKSWLWQGGGGWGWLPWLSIIYQPSLSPVMITWWKSDWEVFGAICLQSHPLEYCREYAAGSLRLRTCSTKAHSSAMGILMGWKCRYIETPMAGEWA